MAGPPAYKRRALRIVDPRYQLRTVASVLVVVFAVGLVSASLAMIMLWQSIYQADPQHQQQLITALIACSMTLLLELVIAVPVVFYVGIIQTGRVVGPIRRMIQTLDRVGEGDFAARIQLRPGDVLEEVAQAINRMAERLGQRFPPQQ